MTTTFVQLNHGWNAQPNAPDPQARVDGDSVVLDFFANPFQFPSFVDGQRICISFRSEWRYGFGAVSDEGWYRGQCRFSGIAPGWGEFYEVSGDLRLEQCKVKWKYLSAGALPGCRHFLFYLRDETFECDAVSWELTS